MDFTFVEKYIPATPHRLWVEDYQPTELSQIVGNPMAVATLDSFLRSDRLPNLLFCGPNGCGKCTAAQIVVKKYLGQHFQAAHLEIIGSIYRGKNVVTEKSDKKKSGADGNSEHRNIINFIRKKMVLPENKTRVITIYDFECMTDEAQMALRRIIEIYSQRVRFVFICQQINQVIEAIQSRTLILKFQALDGQDIVTRLKEISGLDNHPQLPEEIYQTIAVIVNGDLKQAVNYLQVFSHSNGHTLEHFYHLFNIPSVQTLTRVIQACLKHQSASALADIDHMIDNGYCVGDILDIMIKILITQRDLLEDQRVLLIEETIRAINANEQVSSVLHLYRLVVRICRRTEV